MSRSPAFVRRLLLTSFVVVTGFLLVAPIARAEEASGGSSSPWYKDVSANVFLSASYSYNFNTPPSHTNRYRVFDFDSDKLKLDVAELVVQKPVAGRGQAGFRLDATVGASVPRVAASAGLFRDASGRAHDYDIHQGYLSYVVPLGRGLRLDAGKFVTHLGYEVIEGYDGYGDNASRSLLFGYAIPFTHTGVRAGYSLNDRVSALLVLTKGWDDFKDNNSALSVGGQVAVTPVEGVSLAFNYIGGAEQPANDHDVRRVFDVVATWKATGRITLGLNGDHGTEENALVPGGIRDAAWGGVAVYARVALTRSVALGLRGEHFGDPEGARTGVAQTLRELTITPEWQPVKHIVVRGDLRFDHSNVTAFEGAASPVHGQTTTSFNVVYVF